MWKGVLYYETQCQKSVQGQGRWHRRGAVNGIVKIDIGAGNVMSATISMAAIKELGLEAVLAKIG